MKATSADLGEEDWVGNLVLESKRDLVFLWHITNGRFGGPSSSNPEFPSIRNQAISALLAAGCKVGFGEPESVEWRVPEEILIDGKANASKIMEASTAHPKEYEFLVFAIRH
jgi:hypothetical protein